MLLKFRRKKCISNFQIISGWLVVHHTPQCVLSRQWMTGPTSHQLQGIMHHDRGTQAVSSKPASDLIRNWACQRVNMSKILITICIVDRMRGNGYQDLSRQILPSSWSSNPATVIPGDNINRWLGRSRLTDHRQVLLGRFTGMYSSDFCLKKIVQVLVQGPRQLLSFVNVVFGGHTNEYD